MNIHFPLRLVRKGPGYYLIDASGRTVAAMTADKAEAEFICRACNSFQELLDACQAVQEWGLKGKMPDGRWAFDLLAPAISKATAQPTSMPLP